jgi:hypothetical protein
MCYMLCKKRVGKNDEKGERLLQKKEDEKQR